jgi:NAD(P)-dependent dehydrogenase (short-subunit alcohol dehydrogenase family)
MERSLLGEVALVTGAGRGIGRQIALDLAAAGADVGLISRTREQLEDVATRIEAAGGRAMALPADVTDRGAIEARLIELEKRFGPVSILVNNAGTDKPYGPIGVADPDQWWRTQDIHVRGALLTMHAVIPKMRERGRGRIINIASSAAMLVGPNTSAYCVAKATLVRLTEHVQAEIADAGLHAFAVHPGTIMTDMGLAAIEDPAARKWAGRLIDYLATFKDVDPQPGLDRLGQKIVALASGAHDDLSGRYLDLDRSLDHLGTKGAAADAAPSTVSVGVAQ